jgi:Protein of unknown function (DUF2974)
MDRRGKKMTEDNRAPTPAFGTVVIASLVMLVSAGCVSTRPATLQPEVSTSVGKHLLLPSHDLQYMSCDYRRWTSKRYDPAAPPAGVSIADYDNEVSSLHTHSAEGKALAREAFVYAMLANNVYRDDEDKPVFATPGWTVVRRWKSEADLVLEEVEHIENGRVIALAVVFEGTNGNIADWKANLSVWREPVQYAQAQAHVERLRAEPRYRDVPIVLVGHSLGGGIAINVALRQSSPERPLDVYAFNTSPRGFYRPLSPTPAGAIHVLDEHGEWLLAGRAAWWGKFRRLGRPMTYNFLNFKKRHLSKSISEHSIYRFSRALLLLSVGTGDPYAKAVFRANFHQQLPSGDHRPEDARTTEDSEIKVDREFCLDIIERDLPPSP